VRNQFEAVVMEVEMYDVPDEKVVSEYTVAVIARAEPDNEKRYLFRGDAPDRNVGYDRMAERLRKSGGAQSPHRATFACCRYRE
jgi:hypothetical protein